MSPSVGRGEGFAPEINAETELNPRSTHFGGYELGQPKNGESFLKSYLENHCELDSTEDTAVINKSSWRCSNTLM